MTDQKHPDDVIIEEVIEQPKTQITVPNPSYPEKVYVIPIHNRHSSKNSPC